MTTTLSRRRFLLNAGLMAVAAPFVYRLDARGATTAIPRLLLLFHGNGHRRGQWATRRSDEDFDLHRIAAPLEPFRQDLLLFEHLDHKVMEACSYPTTKHGLGSGIAFTGRPVVESGWPTGPSVDQFLAERIGRETPLRSIQLGAGIHDTNVYGRVSFGPGGMALAPEQVPAAAYASMFEPLLGSGQTAAEEAKRRLARRLSVLDTVKDDVCTLRAELGADDRARLDAHCQAIREIEQAMDGSFEGGECEPLEGLITEPWNAANYGQTLRDHMALATLALSCGITRIVALQLGQAHGGLVADDSGATGGSHHHLSHYATSVGDDEPYVKICEWYAQRVAELLTLMSDTPQENGSLLDDTLVVWGSDVSDGEEHGEDDIPWAVFGGRNLGVKGGRMIDAGERNVNDLLVSICHAMGQDDVETFGEPEYCSGPLSLG